MATVAYVCGDGLGVVWFVAALAIVMGRGAVALDAHEGQVVMAIFAFSDGFFIKLVRGVAGGAGVVAFEGRVLELGALFFRMTGITTPRGVVRLFVRFVAILAGLRAEYGFLRVFYVLGGMAIEAIAGLDPRLCVWTVATRAIGPAVYVDGLLVSLGVLVATLAFPGFFA